MTDPLGATLAAATILALTCGLIWLAHGVDRRPASCSGRATGRRRSTRAPAPAGGPVSADPAADAAG